MLLHGSVIGAACAYANDEPFLLMAGAGFDGRVIAALDHRLKAQVGKAAYAGPMIGALAHPVDTLTVTIDGCPHEASWAVIANARHYGGSFVMARRTGIRERGLQAILFKAKNRAELFSQLVALAMGQLDARAASHGDVEMLPCARASISCAASSADPDRRGCLRHHPARDRGRLGRAAADRASGLARERRPAALTFR